MKIEYLKREIFFADFLDDELPEDVKWLLNYFKDLTYRYEKEESGKENWYDKDNQWTIEIWEEHLNYVRFSSKNWRFLEHKYALNFEHIRELIHYMLELTLKRKVFEPYSRLGQLPF